MNLQEAIHQMQSELGLKVEFTVVLLTVALLMSRILPVIILTPFLGGEVVPTEVKIGLGVMMGMVLFPSLASHMQYIPVQALPFILLMLKELFIGLCLSFVVGMIFQAAQVAGTVIDSMAGTNMAQIMVPQIQQQVNLFASFKLQVAVVLFLTLNGHHMVINAFGDSLVLIPLEKFPSFHAGMWPFFDLMARTFAEVMRISLAISAPVFLATFLTDLALGMINRVAPQVQVFFVSMQIKPLVTVMIVFVSIHLILRRLALEYANMFKLVDQAIRLLS
jgi:flagellar biosynthesis protein FliR